MAWRWSKAAQAMLAQDHTMATRCEVWHSGRSVAELAVYSVADQILDGRDALVSGRVDAAADRAILRNLQISLVDTDGTLSRTDVGGLLDPYSAEIVPYRGVVLPSGRVELAPLGVFQLTSTDVSDSPSGLSLDLTGQDRALGYQVPLSSPVFVPSGTPVQDAIRMLLSAVNSGFTWAPWITGHTCGPLLYDTDDEAWASALSLAESVGGWLFHDRLGVPQLAPYATSIVRSAREYVEGGGLLLDVNRTVDADDIRNVVIVRSSSTVIGSTIVATAEDTDPRSPTYAGGGRPRRVRVVVSEGITTQSQAQDAATARLVQELGRSESVSLSAVCDPGLDVGDDALVNRPRAGLFERRLVTSAVTVGLDCQTAMSVTARRSVLTQDGRVVPEEEAA